LFGDNPRPNGDRRESAYNPTFAVKSVYQDVWRPKEIIRERDHVLHCATHRTLPARISVRSKRNPYQTSRSRIRECRAVKEDPQKTSEYRYQKRRTARAI